MLTLKLNQPFCGMGLEGAGAMSMQQMLLLGEW